MEDGLAAIAFPNIISRIFGKSGMWTATLPKVEYNKWLRRVTALTYNRWRKVFSARISALNKLQLKVDESYLGE